jgi:hypothetical protein
LNTNTITACEPATLAWRFFNPYFGTPLFRYAALQHPEDAASIQCVLAIPPKRFDRALLTYLIHNEINALLAAPNPHTWSGRRDRALPLLASVRP